MNTTVTLSADDVRTAVSMPHAIDAARAAFLELDAGAFDQPPRIVLGDGRFLVMSAHPSQTASAMVKTLIGAGAKVPRPSRNPVRSCTHWPRGCAAKTTSSSSGRRCAPASVGAGNAPSSRPLEWPLRTGRSHAC